MGCVSSNLLNQDNEVTQLGSSALSHHIVSLTSTTYGLLTLDPPPLPQTQTPTTPPIPTPRFTLPDPMPLWSDRKPHRSDNPEIIHWPDFTDSFRFSPLESRVLRPLSFNVLSKPTTTKNNNNGSFLDKYEELCPPKGENRVVIYTTTLRGVRKTFEACNAVRSAIENFGIMVCERDVSMDRGFREELREMMTGKGRDETVPPRVFVKGRYVGGAEEVIRVIEEGHFGELVDGVERKRVKGVCEGCGGVRFLPCFRCSGSCKLVVMVKGEYGRGTGNDVVVRCTDCNENGLL
ncbi:Glutaredoxin domain-containing protein [Cephalotus follicularis]|uniref:Glutaredoxin domain-containing protein n=1 Tax=Cephalotus follicularis TaxID=3775 RepID=A0A1Q3D8X2_CEPFO|nr:Glutaredoxin domain-containing protein [Cephalotus follicularis]